MKRNYIVSLLTVLILTNSITPLLAIDQPAKPATAAVKKSPKREWFKSGSPEAVILHTAAFMFGQLGLFASGFCLYHNFKELNNHSSQPLLKKMFSPKANEIIKDLGFFGTSMSILIYSIRELAKDFDALDAGPTDDNKELKKELNNEKN